MKRFLPTAWLLLLLAGLTMACASPPAATPTPATAPAATPPTDDPTLATRGGEPRSAGYWLLWNSCAPDNRAETARANGGRAAGWIIVDDLLQDPGILLGELAVETCPQAVSLLQQQDLSGAAQADDPAYALARHLLAAQLNLATGALSCPAADQAVQAGQLLLISLGFDGEGPTLAPGTPRQQDQALAGELADLLARYNGGLLCRPAGESQDGVQG